MSTTVVAGNVAEFREGVPHLVTTDGSGPVAVVLWQGNVYAFRGVCPHQQGPISAGHVRLPLTSEHSGQADLDADKPVIVCPWHRWEYELETGRGIRRAGFRIRTYRAWLERDLVMVDMGSRPAAVGRGSPGERSDNA